MYTGITNVKSKGLAERYGLRVRGTYAEGQMPLKEVSVAKNTPAFRVVEDAERAVAFVESMKASGKDSCLSTELGTGSTRETAGGSLKREWSTRTP